MVVLKPYESLRWVSWLLVVSLAVQLQLGLGQANTTADKDKLLAFATSFTSVDGSLLASWDTTTDPCAGNGWPGVMCQCSDLPSMVQQGCSNTPDPSGLRVKGLDLRPMSSSMQKLQGPVPDALGDLDQLVYLDLSDNQLRSVVPGHTTRLCMRCRLFVVCNSWAIASASQ